MHLRYERRPGVCAECTGVQKVKYRVLDRKPVMDYRIDVVIHLDGKTIHQGTLLALTM